jgi:uncharacterized protein VirK/YbjX
LNEIFKLGKRIYGHRDTTDFNIQRLLVFWLRAAASSHEVLGLKDFFAQSANLKELEKDNAIFYEQLTRHVFYHQSTLAERRQMVEQHFSFCQQAFCFPVLREIYYDGRVILWESPFQEDLLSFGLDFMYVDRKEGLMSLDLKWGDERIYHITFSCGYDKEGRSCLKIGALQGSLGGQEIIHALTKHCFAYRTKNLMLYGLRLLAQGLGIEKIYAVSNQGFFTNTHVRMDRKLKTSLDEFWQEAGGQMLEDPRFFELPVQEKRKAIEEVKSQKRNLYRKRYALLDSIAAEFQENLQMHIKPRHKNIASAEAIEKINE